MSSPERAYAEACTDQNREAFADELRRLHADDPKFLLTLTRLVHMGNRDAARVISQMPATERKHLLEWLIPAARVGLSICTFTMEDKYRPDTTGGTR